MIPPTPSPFYGCYILSAADKPNRNCSLWGTHKNCHGPEEKKTQKGRLKIITIKIIISLAREGIVSYWLSLKGPPLLESHSVVSSDFLVLGRLVFVWSIGPFNDRTIDTKFGF